MWFYILNVNNESEDESDCEIKIVCSVKISSDLLVKVIVGDIIVPAHDLTWLFPSDLKLRKWSLFENLLIRYNV